MEAFLDHVPDNPDGRMGYYLTVVPVYTTQEFPFAIKDLEAELSKELPLERAVSAC